MVTEISEALLMRIYLENHYVIVIQSGDFYLPRLSPEGRIGQQITKAIYAAIRDTALRSQLSVIGFGGTATYGNKGCIASLEALFQRILQWKISSLRCNELLLRRVFRALDGVVKSPDFLF